MSALGDWLGPREVSLTDIGAVVVFSILVGCWIGWRGVRS